MFKKFLIIFCIMVFIGMVFSTPDAEAAPSGTLEDRVNVCWSPTARDGGYSALPCVWYAPVQNPGGPQQSTLVRRSGRIEYIREGRARNLFVAAVQAGRTP